jgi:uncharacterized protein YndB with AHSA1/START domain
MSMAFDLARRSPDITWPIGFDPADSDLFAHNAITIAAPPSVVWPHIVTASAWPTWFANATAVTVASGVDVLVADANFVWTTFGMSIQSRVYKLVEAEELGWFGLGSAGEPSFAIEWLLTATNEGSHVVLEEVGIGAVATSFRENDERALHDSHEIWLNALRERSISGR